MPQIPKWRDIDFDFSINKNPRDYYPSINHDMLLTRMLRREHRAMHREGFNRIYLVTGLHRSGKSIFACTLGHLLDKTFWPNFEKRVCFTAEQFTDAIDRQKKRGFNGAVTVFDEAGISYGSRSWYDISNKCINFALQSTGFAQNCIIFVSQDPSFLDSQSRRLVHKIFICNRKGTEYATVRPYDIHYSKKSSRNRQYFYYPRTVVQYPTRAKSNKFVLTKIRWPKPPEELLERYRRHAQSWKSKIMEDSKNAIAELKMEHGKFQDMSNDERAKWIVNRVEDMPILLSKRSSPEKPTVDQDVVADVMSISRRNAKVCARYAEQLLKEEANLEEIHEN